MDYTPHTEEEIREMLRRVGAASLEDLFAHLPKEILSPPIDLPEPLPEWKVLEELRRLAAQNLPAHKAFLGGGVRSHHVPPVVQALAARGEILTAYTPYAPSGRRGGWGFWSPRGSTPSTARCFGPTSRPWGPSS